MNKAKLEYLNRVVRPDFEKTMGRIYNLARHPEDYTKYLFHDTQVAWGTWMDAEEFYHQDDLK